MQKIISFAGKLLFTIALLNTQNSWGQIWIGDDLYVRNQLNFDDKADRNVANKRRWFIYSNNGILTFSGQAAGLPGVDRVFINLDGNVGIGTTNPTKKLDVNGDICIANNVRRKSIYTWDASNEAWRIGMNANPGFTRTLTTGEVQYLTYESSPGGSIQGFAVGANGGQSGFEITGDHRAYFRNTLRIGTSSFPTDATYRLAVAGKIISEGVKVQAVTNWADYVFDPGFRLRPLQEVESFIQANKHLPDVPSEAEIKQNGMDLPEMHKIQMQKIEELYLYVIELEKKNQTLQEANKNLENRIQQLEKK